MSSTITKVKKTKKSGLKLPVATSISNLHTAELTPGQRQEWEIKLAQTKDLDKDLKKELARLESSLQQATKTKDVQMVDEVAGLLNKLKLLEKKLQARIKDIKDKLFTVPPELMPWLEKIKQDCPDYLAECKKAGGWLYRGETGPSAFMAKSWDARKARDSNQQAQELFDQMLVQSGAVALRGNSIFAIGDYWHTIQFGKQKYIVFPVTGKSHYTYTSAHDVVLDNVADVAITPAQKDTLRKKLKPYVTELGKQFKKGEEPVWYEDLVTAVKSKWWGWEYMVRKIQETKDEPGVKDVIPAEYFDPEFTAKQSKLKNFIERWKPATTDLAKGIKTNREIYISGVYYALEVKTYGKYVSAYFEVPLHPGIKD